MPRDPLNPLTGRSRLDEDCGLISAENKKGPAEAATSPSHGSNTPAKGNAVNKQHGSAPRVERTSFLDMEGPIGDAFQLVSIVEAMVDDTLDCREATRVGDDYSFTISSDQLDRLRFIALQATLANRNLRKQFSELALRALCS